jgi:hypothetical protein
MRRMNVQKVGNQDAQKYRAIATHLGNRKKQGAAPASKWEAKWTLTLIGKDTSANE